MPVEFQKNRHARLAAKFNLRSPKEVEDLERHFQALREARLPKKISSRRMGPPPGMGVTAPVKMNPETVRELRRLAESGVEYAELGKRFGISSSTASKIVRRLSWKDV